MELYIGYWIGVVAGILIGVFCTNMRKSHGVLKIDKTNPEKDRYLFEIDDLDKIGKNKWIRLSIRNAHINDTH